MSPADTSAPRLLTVLILLLAATMLLNYVDRGTLSTAAPLMMGDLGLSATQFGLAASAFFWVYAPVQVLVGWLCDRLNVFRLFAIAMAICAVTTGAMGLATGVASLIFLRILLGLGESVAFPGSSKIIARYVPKDHRGIANSAVAAALAVGPGLGTLVGGMIMAVFGWRVMFMVFAALTLCWLAPWFGVTGKFAPAGNLSPEPQIRMGQLLRLSPLWAMSIGHFIGNLTLYFVMTWLPLYLVQVRGMSIVEMMLLTSAAYAAQAASALIVGWWSDRMVRSGSHEGRVRKAFVVIGHAGVAAATLGIAYASTLPMLIACMIAVGAFQGLNGPNIFALAQIFAGPRAAGSWVGVQNAIANVAGMVGPVATGLIIDRAGGFDSAFVVTAAIGILGVVWWFFAVPRAEQIAFDF